MADKKVVEILLPVVEVTLLEDRAFVVRRGNVSLPAGFSRLVVPGVAPVIVDKTVTPRAEGPVEVHDVRVVRFAKILREARPAEARELEEALEKAREEAGTVQRRAALIDGQIKGFERLEELALNEIVEDAAWGRDAWESGRERIALLEERAVAFHAEQAAAMAANESRFQAIGDLERRLAAVKSPSTCVGARFEIDVEASAAGSCILGLEYLVPGACWRPWHVADSASPGKNVVRFRSEACVWQNTGEDWMGVRLLFSTQRPSLGAEPPSLVSDVLATRKKASEIVVTEREQAVQTTGLGSATDRQVDEMPGIDDGGEVLALRAADPADIPSDGRPYRVPYGEFETGGETERVLMPELAPCAFFRTVQPNKGGKPILAGPVDLLIEGGYSGRTQVKFVAPGERFVLGWGIEPALRVHRETAKKDEEASILSGWLVSRRFVKLRLSNVGAEAISVNVTERVPVSEIEQVEITVDPKETTGAKAPDKDGFIAWEVTLPPHGRETLQLTYTIRKRKAVTGL